jgi:hypothetical protein
MQLISYVQTVTRQAVTLIRESWRFESLYILQGKIRPTCHALSTLSPSMAINHTYLTWSAYRNISRAEDRFGWIPLLPRKRAPDTIHITSADRYMGLYLVSLLSQPVKQQA